VRQLVGAAAALAATGTLMAALPAALIGALIVAVAAFALVVDQVKRLAFRRFLLH